MKYFLLSISAFIFCAANAQLEFKVHSIKLPADVSYYDNQYSSLYISNDKLYLMSESRLEDNAQAFLTSVDLTDLQKAVNDSAYQPAFVKNPIYGLDVLRSKMQAGSDSYEGLEATVIKNNTVYLSVETSTPSNNCYLVKGYFAGGKIYMDTTKMLKLAKPKDANGQNIYNAGFEALEIMGDKLYAFFEYNYFPDKNFVYCIDTSFNKSSLQKIPIDKTPFRITDITKSYKPNHLIGINYFYKGEGKDEVYRVPQTDTANYPLTQNTEGYTSYCRLMDIQLENDSFRCKPLAALPSEYWGYNWEGLAAYKNGFFITNDKYTPSRPYKTNLLYLEIER